MKKIIPVVTALLFVFSIPVLPQARAAPVPPGTPTVKTNENALALNAAGAWDTVPGVGDIATWTAVETTANTAALGADTTWQGIQIANPGGLVTISAGNTLTLGVAATDIDMTAATQDLTIAAPMILGAANTWDVATGRTLTVSAATITNAANTLTVQGAGTTAISGIIGAGAGGLTKAGSGTLTLSGVNTFTGATAVSAGTLALDSTGTIATSSGVTASGTGTFSIAAAKTIASLTLNNTSVLTLGANTLTLAGAGTVSTGSATTQVNSTFTSGTTFGKITATGGNSTLTTGTTVNLTVSGYVPAGSYTLLDGAAGVGIGTVTIVDSSPAVAFTQTGAAGADLVLSATRVTAGVTTTANATAVADAANAAGTPTGDFATALGAIDALTTSSAVDDAYAQMDPVVNAGVNVGSFNQVNQALNALSQHLYETYNGPGASPQTGVSTGDSFVNQAIWAKGFGANADQDTRSGIAGYDANMWGVIGGSDWEVADNMRLGLSGGYASTSVDNKGADGGGTDIDSVQGTIYLNYDDPSPWYGTGGFSFNWNMYDGTRNIAFGTINRTAKSDYDGQQYTGFGEIGYVIKNMDIEPNQEWDIVPLAGLTYSHLAVDSYTETEAGDLSLHVNGQDYDLLQSGLGLRVERPWTTNDGKFVPEIHGKWLYDFIGDKAATTATFTGGGSSFSTNGASPAQSSFDVGAGIAFYSKGNISISATYDLELKSDYTSHTGQGVIRYTF